MESLDHKITNMRSFIYEHAKEICPYLNNTGIQNIEDAHGIILWSPCLFVTKQIARKYVDMITSCSSSYVACHPTRNIVTTDLHTRGTKFNVTYKITEHYIEFDVYHFCHTHNDKSICIDFIKDMTNKNNFENKRYIFLLHGIDVLPLKTVKSLQKIIETTADNAYYIFTCSPGQI